MNDQVARIHTGQWDRRLAGWPSLAAGSSHVILLRSACKFHAKDCREWMCFVAEEQRVCNRNGSSWSLGSHLSRSVQLSGLSVGSSCRSGPRITVTQDGTVVILKCCVHLEPQ